MSEHDMRELLRYAVSFSEVAFARDGFIAPLWHAVTRDGDHIIQTPPSPDKDTAAAMIRALFELRDVVRYIWMSEAWSVEKHPLTDADMALIARKGAKAHPDHIEIIAFQGEDEIAGLFTAHRQIIRPKHGRATLGPLKMLTDFQSQRTVPAHSEGRLVGMLPVKGRKQ